MKRLEDVRLVRGEGAYTADLADSETLHCWFVRSPFAHGIIRGIDTTGAESAPGVVAVLTAADLDLNDIPAVFGRGVGAEYMTRPPLCRDRVRHVGDAIAVVVAASARQAEDAAELVWPDIEDLEANTDPESAENAPALYEAGGNVVARLSLANGPVPDLEPDISSTVTVHSNRLAPLAIETNGIVVEPEADEIRVWCGHQAPHRFRDEMATILGIEPEKIRVTVPDVGGGFGMKGRFFPEYPVVAAAALRLDRRLSWVQTRREHFATGTHGRGMRHRVTLDGYADGRIARARIDLLADVGAYPHNGSAVPLFTRLVSPGLYDIPRLEIETTIVVTNTAPTGSYRGAGRPEAALAIERAIDAFARAAGIDPIEVRRRNLIRRLPTVTATGAKYDSGDYAAVLERALEMIGVDAVRSEQAARLAAGRDPIGLGIGSFIERAGGAPDSGEYARVELDPFGIVVRTGSVDTGQGHQTVWTQVARAVFGEVPVRFVSKDTAQVADGVGSFASRSAQLGASAVQRMSASVLEQARRRAAEHLEAAEADLVYADGVFSVAGVPDSGVSLWEVVEEAPIADEEMFVAGAQTFPYGAHVAVVEVSLETGQVRVLDLVAVDDCGAVLNPMIVEGQMHGSLTQGLGQALFEEVRYDESGQPLTATLMDYLAPRAADLPEPVMDRFVSPAPSNPLGVKGSGEAGCIGAPPAVLNAVLDALAPYGVRDLQLPLRPERVWSAIREVSRDG